MRIDGTDIGTSYPPYVVAEMSCCHNGSLETALKLIDAAKDAGASAIKTQLYEPARLAIARGGLDKVLDTGPWAGMTLFDLYTQAHTPQAWFPVLMEYAERSGITLFSSVFDIEGVEFLAALGAPVFKISSFNNKDKRLIVKAASTGKKVIVSSGMAGLMDMGLACKWIIEIGAQPAILHCVSAYPCPIEEADLDRISSYRHQLQVPVGFSDHTLGNDAAIGAVALGACIIEKHLTLSRADGGLDAAFSAEPHEFKALVASVNNVWRACQPPSGSAEAYKDLQVKAA
jgi:N-acetylneuraminate synthase